jgi:hypothetical protein
VWKALQRRHANRKYIMTNKNNKVSINSFCSQEQLEKFLDKVCVFDLSFMDRSITGRVKEVGKDFILLEMRDGRLLCAKIDCVQGFGMVKNQPSGAV